MCNKRPFSRNLLALVEGLFWAKSVLLGMQISRDAQDTDLEAINIFILWDGL